MATTYIRRTDGRRAPQGSRSNFGGSSSNGGGSRSGGDRGRSYDNNSRGGSSFGGGRSRGNGGGSRSGGGKRGHQEMDVDLSKLINKAKPQEDVPAYVPDVAFADFAIDDQLKQNIIAKGYLHPTPIQDKAIPFVLNGEDIVGMANTGTGKTAAFLIPLIDKVLKDRTERVLIMVPTRELAIQIEEEFYGFAKRLQINAVTCVGGAGIEPQMRGLRRNPNFVIGTPGRLKDLMERRTLSLGGFNTVVLDEADRMLDMGFINDMREIMSTMPTPRHTLFFTATLSRDIEALIGGFLHNPARVSVKTRDTAHTIDQDVVRVRTQDKLAKLLDMLADAKEFDKVLVFGRTKHGVERLTNDLNRAGIPSESIHGDKTQGRRQKALGLFKQNHVRVLVATDVAARGLDISGVSHVINFDLPATYEDYTHRIGRTGRAGKTGKALTFIAE
ncbi:MAG: box helicase, ATP-dependent helicase RhlE [Parcubacteria group bacterium]|nr:box helicase, ATP-dependent helicase RhlE [Parcubacteria group bacterium]